MVQVVQVQANVWTELDPPLKGLVIMLSIGLVMLLIGAIRGRR